MKKKDPSKEIFQKYYSPRGKILEVELNDNTILEGVFVSFIHGDESIGESFILKWHFLDEKDISKHNSLVFIDATEEYSRTIMQEDIKNVKFKK